MAPKTGSHAHCRQSASSRCDRHCCGAADVESLVASTALYAIPGGTLRPDDAAAACRTWLTALIAPLNFHPAPNSVDIVAIRPRGELVDCVRILPDEFGTYASLLCIPWTTKVWAADKRWKNTHYPLHEVAVQSEGVPLLLPIRALGRIDVDHARDAVVRALDEVEREFATARDFATRLGGQWSTLASQLLRVL